MSETVTRTETVSYSNSGRTYPRQLTKGKHKGEWVNSREQEHRLYRADRLAKKRSESRVGTLNGEYFVALYESTIEPLGRRGVINLFNETLKLFGVGPQS